MKSFYAIGIILLFISTIGEGQYKTPADYPLMVGTYVEGYANSAADNNLWPTDAASYPNLVDWLEAVGLGSPYGKWYPKTDSTKAINGTAFQGSDDDEPPQLSMTVTGLNPAMSYDVYVVYWPKLTSWSTWAALEGEPLEECTYADADVVFFYDGGTGVQGCQEYIGSVSGVSDFTVVVAAPPNQPDKDDRAWFDGISVVGLDPSWQLEFTPNGQPVDETVDFDQTAIFQAVFRSDPEPTVVWYNGSGPVDANDPDITVTTTYDSQTEEYTTTLQIANAVITDAGQYYCEIDNVPLAAISSNIVNLTVNSSRLVAHWTMDQADYNGTAYIDEIAGLTADPAGTPVFVDGARETAGAVQVTPTTGWATSENMLEVNLTEAFTVSLWVNWQGGAPMGSDDLFVESGPYNLAAIDAIKADNKWQHVCITSQNNAMQIYLNGLPVQSGTVPTGDLTSLALEMGHLGGEQTFNGSLDDIRLYDYALNATEVWTLFTARENCTLPYAREWDLSGPDHLADCVIDFYDFSAFAELWLSSVDLNDLSAFVDAWLTTGMME
ncbi:MAG: hypothetical protein JW709_11360 [Sedimentisphaerales bacterium]|nr:hypothetical protein [Sedimentisphaerales bacterium]